MKSEKRISWEERVGSRIVRVEWKGSRVNGVCVCVRGMREGVEVSRVSK